jgi:hypothetical protein
MPKINPAPYSVEAVLAELEAVRDPKIAAIFGRRNPDGVVLGVRFGDMDVISKKIVPDANLAAALWRSGSFEARVIALRVMPDGALTEAQADAWVGDLDFPILADDLARLVYKRPFARKRMEAWTASDQDFVRRTGYALLYGFAADRSVEISDEEWLVWLDRIGKEIHQSPNWSRESMIVLPVAIGLRDDTLYAPALATASAFGKIEVFHGDKTNCKVPDPVALLENPRTRIKPY